MSTRLILLLFALFFAAAPPALAQGRFVRPHDGNGAVPLERILPQIRARHPGTFSDADGPFADPAGVLHYRLKWVTPEGRVIWLDTDARTGRVLSVNHGWGGYGPYPRGYMPGRRGVPDAPPPAMEGSHRWREVPGNRFGPVFRGGFHGGHGGHGGHHGRQGR